MSTTDMNLKTKDKTDKIIKLVKITQIAEKIAAVCIKRDFLINPLLYPEQMTTMPD